MQQQDGREVIIDVTRLLGRLWKGRLATGVDRVGLAYLKYFHDRSVALIRVRSYFFFLHPSFSRSCIALLCAPPVHFRMAVIGLFLKNFWRIDCRAKHQFFFNTGHSGLEHPGYARWLSRLAVRPIYFIHDLIPITHPQFSRVGEPAKHHWRMHNALQTGVGIISNSMDTLQVLKNYAHQHAWPMPASAVALLAPACLPMPASERPMSEAYFLILGTIEGRKNHRLLLSVWRQMQASQQDCPRLVIIGQRGWRCDEVLAQLDHQAAAFQGTVIELTHCSDAQLATYLKHARALLFPSFVEGYGLPLIEALQMGTPVIASDLPVFHEVAGDIPDYLNPKDAQAWLACIRAYQQADSTRRDAQLARMYGFVAPNWAQHFRAVEGLLARLS
jgi:glycosyltransferase involved in cell wall biosynthesis